MNAILQRFVAHKSELRYWMHQPFKIGEWLYATNGHIAVRVPAGQEVFDGTPKTVDVEKLFDGARSVMAPTTGAELPALPKALPCLFCGGSGMVWMCGDCGGGGASGCADCETCGGVGQLTKPGSDTDLPQECGDCCGTGDDRQQRVTVGAKDYARRYLAKIADLPGLAFHQTPNEDIDPAFFTFDGGEGLLMPLRKRRTTK